MFLSYIRHRLPNAQGDALTQALEVAITEKRIREDAAFLRCAHGLVRQWLEHKAAQEQAAATERRWFTHEMQEAMEAARPPIDAKAIRVRLNKPGVRARLGQEASALERSLTECETDHRPFWSSLNTAHSERELKACNDLFDQVESKPLTEEQARAVICFDNRVQVVASAGSGKTSTMVAKAAYAVHRGFVAPERIVLLAFNKKAAEELKERAAKSFERLGIEGLSVEASTLHALGLRIIGKATGEKPDIPDWATDTVGGFRKLAEIIDQIKDCFPAFRTQWDLFRFVFGRDLPAFGSQGSVDVWDHQGNGRLRTSNGESVRSLEEVMIANWLFLNGVNYVYEKHYEFKTADEAHRQYRPDFYYPDINLYHEHFALNAKGEAPPRFEGYLQEVEWKRQLHRDRDTALFETTSHGIRSGFDFRRLEDELTTRGVVLDPNPDREIPLGGEKPMKPVELMGLVRTFMSHAKSNCLTISMLHQRLEEELNLAAPPLLQNQQSQLQGRMRMVLEAAYGIRQDQDGALAVQVSAEDHLVSLDGTFRPQPPVGVTLKEAMGALLDSAFAHRFPAHPIFGQEVKFAALNKVLKEIEAAAEEPQQRRFIEDRAVRQILGGFAGPLKLGTMNQGLTHFILDDHWANHFTRLSAKQGGGAMTVKRLRALIDQPRPMGLPREVENLIILACAAQADRTISLRGAPVRGAIERLDDDAELLAQPLPDEATWTKARERAAEVFGLVPSEVRKGATVARLASELLDKAQTARPPLATLTSVLRTRMAASGVTPENAPRMITLLSASVLVTDLTASVEPLTVVRSLAESDLQTSESAIGRSISSAPVLASFLSSFEWDVLAAAASLSDHRRVAAEQIGRSVAEALEADEHVVPLEVRLREAQRNAFRLLAAVVPGGGGAGAGAGAQTRNADTSNRPPPGGKESDIEVDGSGPSPEILEERVWDVLPLKDAMVELDRLKSRLGAEPGARLSISWRLIRDGAKG